MTETNLLAIVGSLRVGSVNAATARAAASAGPDGVKVTLYDVSDLTLYNGDEEEAGPPATVIAPEPTDVPMALATSLAPMPQVM